MAEQTSDEQSIAESGRDRRSGSSLIQFRAGDLSTELESRGTSSHVAKRDLDRYYQLLTATLAEVNLGFGEIVVVAYAIDSKFFNRPKKLNEKPVDVYTLKYGIAGAVEDTLHSRTFLRRLCGWIVSNFVTEGSALPTDAYSDGVSASNDEYIESVQDVFSKEISQNELLDKIRRLSAARALAIFDAVEQLRLLVETDIPWPEYDLDDALLKVGLTKSHDRSGLAKLFTRPFNQRKRG